MVIDVLEELSASVLMLKQSKAKMLHPEDKRQCDSSEHWYLIVRHDVTPQKT
jgi:hypothetical protein